MLQILSQRFLRAPARLVQCGLALFFGGACALLLGMVAQLGDGGSPAGLAERFPAIPTWFVPEGAAGFTAATVLVCWGVWAMGAGLRQARERQSS